MLKKKPTISIVVCLCFLTASCSSVINREGYSMDSSMVNQANCENTIIVKSLDYDPQLVSVVGKISARDSGFSVNCSETYVIDSFKKEACAIGADVVNITKDAQPNFWTTCYRAEAEFLRINDRDKLNQLKSDSRYSTDNVGNRSKYTECMNKGVVAAGALGGLIGSLVLYSICKSKYGEDK